MSADDLLQPSVPRDQRAAGDRPWVLYSQFWVAFFGGVTPLAIVAYVNAGRLGLSRAVRAWMIVLTAIALGVVLALWLQRPHSGDFVSFARTARDLRLASRVTAVALFLVFTAMQKRADTRYQVLGAGEYASLWKFGLFVTLVFGTLQSLLMAWLGWIF